MNDDIKIAFVHKGNSWYLPYVLNQAVAFNKENVVLIKDAGPNVDIKGVDNIYINNLKDEMSLKFVENYIHSSSNSHNYELFCWLRWFYLLEYMKQNNIKKIFYSDSDGLIYESVNEIYNIYGGDKLKCRLLTPLQEH